MKAIIILALVMASCESGELCSSDYTASCVHNCFCGIKNIDLTADEDISRTERDACRATLCSDPALCPSTIGLPSVAISLQNCAINLIDCSRRNVVSKGGKVIHLLDRVTVSECVCNGLSRRCTGEDCFQNHRCQSIAEDLQLPGIDVTSGECAFFDIPRCVGCACIPTFALEKPIVYSPPA